jgi:serine/threonine protein phosphatase PrpC
MERILKYFDSFVAQSKYSLCPKNAAIFSDFITDKQNINAVKIIQENQEMMLDKWVVKNKINDIILQSLMLPNGTVNKKYESKIDFKALDWDEMIYFEINGLTEVGLVFDDNSDIISGIPIISGDLKIKLLFRVNGEEENSVLNEKALTLIINPDPKSLWKNLDSDKNDPFWKEDVASLASNFQDKKIVISSKRGRSHANVGSFREDHFEFKNYENTGWSLVAVSDGAGSAKCSRKGSAIACESIVSYFEENFSSENLSEFDLILENHHKGIDEESTKKISHFVYNNLSKAAHFAHKQLELFSIENEMPLNDLHATLIFALVKKYSFGYAVLTFGVGDCPIGLLNKDLSEINLMNWLDVGEFGGGTRFVTMPEIFQSEKFSTRFGFKLIDDFSYLILMTDGIYDPKFVVEANLEKIEKWNEFLSDLKGNNEDAKKVDFQYDSMDVKDQLSEWMDFWNPGNHDDRTLALIY